MQWYRNCGIWNDDQKQVVDTWISRATFSEFSKPASIWKNIPGSKEQRHGLCFEQALISEYVHLSHQQHCFYVECLEQLLFEMIRTVESECRSKISQHMTLFNMLPSVVAIFFRKYSFAQVQHLHVLVPSLQLQKDK